MAWEYEELFDVKAGTEMPLLWQTIPTEIRAGRMGYRTKTTKAGPRLEAEIYPLFGREDAGRARAAKANVTPAAMKRLNNERAKRYLVQLCDANFTERDQHVTLTYTGQPPEYEQAQRDVRNFLAKIKRRREKLGMEPLKYIYTIEDDEDGRKHRIHVHMLLSGGIERETIERIWAKGYANVDRLQPTENGLEALARYLTKQQRNRRKWAASKNLKKPKVRISDSKVSNARVRRIAHDYQNDAKEIMEKVYPGYVFVSATVHYSDVIDGVYIRCVMRELDRRERNARKTEKPVCERMRGKDRDMQDGVHKDKGL